MILHFSFCIGWTFRRWSRSLQSSTWFSSAVWRTQNCTWRNGYECEIVESPPWAADSPTNCPICLHILRDPQLTNCGHSFCKMCMKQAQASKAKTCPECKQTKVTTFPQENLQWLLNELQVRCTFQNEERTCNWMEKLRALDKHLNWIPPCEDELLTGCELVTIRCNLWLFDATCDYSMQLVTIRCNLWLFDAMLPVRLKSPAKTWQTTWMKEEHATKLHSKDKERAENQAFTSEPL